MKLAFGDFLPDLPDHASPGVTEAVNVYPGSRGYRPVGQFKAAGVALPAPCIGAGSFVSDDGVAIIVAGTSSGLYRHTVSAWELLADGYVTPVEGRWRFAQFGGLAVATNGADDPVKIDLSDGSVASLGGTPPTMQFLAVVYNFLVGAIIDGKTNRIAWSGENDAEWWTFAQRKSDYNDFADGGPITGLVGGEIGLVLQRNAVRRMAYVGGNVLFRFDKISANDGCASVHTVAQYGGLAFWYSDSGFKMWDGAQIKSIGFEQVDASFAAENPISSLVRMSTAIDSQRNTVAWSTTEKMWVYNWQLGKWSTIEQPAQIITTGVSRAPTLDEQDAMVGPPDDDLDTPGLISFDDARFRGGDPRFYIVANGVIGTMSGDNMPARLQGRKVEMIEGRDARLSRVRPMSDATDGITLTLDTWQRLGDDAVSRDFTTLNASGEMPVRARGRFVRAKLAIAADQAWTYVQGVDATLQAGGSR